MGTRGAFSSWRRGGRTWTRLTKPRELEPDTLKKEGKMRRVAQLIRDL